MGQMVEKNVYQNYMLRRRIAFHSKWIFNQKNNNNEIHLPFIFAMRITWQRFDDKE